MLLPACTALEIWLWISRLPCVRWSRVLFVMTGRLAASGGKSHSWVTATSWSPSPSAKTISVALGRSEQILKLGVIRSKGNRGMPEAGLEADVERFWPESSYPLERA
jgi:hypothetical protein